MKNADLTEKKWNSVKHKKIITIYKNKTHIFLKDVDIEKVLVSNKISFGEKKYIYIGYLYNDHKVQPLHIMLLKTSTYVNSYDGQTKLMYFLIEDDELPEKYYAIGNKVSTDIKKNLILNLSTIKDFWKTKQNLMVMKLQTFMIKNS